MEEEEGEEEGDSSWGFVVMPLAGGGVVALMSRVEGSLGETS
jgi:hypothetical protein